MKERQFHPIFNGKTVNVLEVAHIVGDHSQPLCFGCTSDEQVEVFDSFPCIPKTYTLLGENMHSFGKRNDLNDRHKIGNLFKVLFCLIALVCTDNQFSNNHIVDKAGIHSHGIQFLAHETVSPEQSHADAGVKKVSFHNSTSNVL